MTTDTDNTDTPAEPVEHRGTWWQDPGGWYRANCTCGWSDTTWASIRAAAAKWHNHKANTNG